MATPRRLRTPGPRFPPSTPPPPAPNRTVTKHGSIQFAQELLSTFSTALGEVALQPTTGGVFRVELIVPAADDVSGTDPAPPGGAAGFHARAVLPAAVAGPPPTRTHRLWDRAVDGGFPETKELKRRVRDVVDPARDLGHVDRDYARRPPAAHDMTAGQDGEEKGKGEGSADERPLAPHGVGAHTKKPPISATDEVRELLEARHRAREESGGTVEGSGSSGAAEGKRGGKECEDCA